MAAFGNSIKLHTLETEHCKEELHENPEKESDDGDALETILCHVGEFGIYQKWLFMAMSPFGFFFAFVYFVQMFVTATPQQHWCHVPELSHLDAELRRNLSIPSTPEGDLERCEVYAADWSIVLQNLTPPGPGTPRIPCQHGWDFKYEDIPYPTVTSERFWVCDQAGLAPLAQSLFFVGSILGAMIFGIIADKCGRVPALIGANLIGCLGGVATVFTSGFLDFTFCRFIVGMSYDNCFMMIYILALEYMGPRHRTWVANMSIALFFGAGCLILPWLALWIADWRKLLIFTSLPGVIVLTAPWLLPESARWLLSRGRVSQAVDVLKKFEKINRTKIPEDVLDDFLASSRRTKKTNEGMKELLKSSPLRLMLVYMVAVYMACALVFDGLVRMSEALGLDFFITFTLTSATEIPSVTLLAFILDKWGRRWLTTGPMVIAGVLTFGAAVVPRGIASVSLAIMARFCINMSYNAAIQWATELLPTGARATGSSLVHASGYVATILSPFVIYSERLWRPLPLVVLSGVALVGGAVGLLLPETCNRPMPQTIADGEHIVRSHTFCGKAEEIEDNKWGQMEALKK